MKERTGKDYCKAYRAYLDRRYFDRSEDVALGVFFEYFFAVEAEIMRSPVGAASVEISRKLKDKLNATL